MVTKVLVSDVDPKNRELISGLLKESGCEVEAAEDSAEVFEKTREFMPDLIMVDVQMPGMDGLETLKRIKRTAGNGNAKVIAMVSRDKKAGAQEMEKAGFDGYFPKPADTAKLRELITDFLQKRKSNAGKPKILCVDDQLLNLKLLEAILEPAGYEVLSAGEGYSALVTLKNQDIDIVLLDVMMPGIDGYDVCRMIKASAETARVPVIMITSLSSREDRIKSIDAGAEDFITKPFEATEVLTRIKKLIEIKEQDAKIISLFGMLAGLAERGNRSAELMEYRRFDFLSEVDALIRGTTSGRGRGPRGMLLGTAETGWVNYDLSDPHAYRPGRRLSNGNLSFLLKGHARIFFANEGENLSGEADMAAHAMAEDGINPGNFICRAGEGLCVTAYDSRKVVNEQDTLVLKAISMQIIYMRSIFSEIQEKEKAFDYLVHTIARAAEANDEDTGTHIIRVGEYAAFLSEKMGLDPLFTERIRMQAQLHDAGKLHVPTGILRKPGPLTAEEFEVMKLHTIYGAKIIGKHGRLDMANKIANFHHEKWDGSGYPIGLKGLEIPIEARITAVADQYDALRHARIYKPALSHERACEIMTKGDGRTKPEHFDPSVLSVFIERSAVFEEMYNELK